MVARLSPRAARYLIRVALALVPVAAALLPSADGAGWGPVTRLDARLQDARTRMILPRTPDPRIVIVDIDDASLAEFGRWPWPRDRLARLLDELFDRQQVALVGFGRAFETPDDSTGLSRLRELAEGELRDVPAFVQRLRTIESRLDADGQFARALADRPVVLGYHVISKAAGETASEPDGMSTGVLPAPAMPAEALQGRGVRVTEWRAYRATIERLAAAAPAAGFLEFDTDPDGRVRAVPLLGVHQGQYHEALALAMFRLLLGGLPIEPGFPQARFPARYHGLDSLHLRQGGVSVSIPVSQGVQARLPWRGPGGPQGGSFRYVPAADLLAGRVPVGSLEGKLILVGATAAGLETRHDTPAGEAMPAIEVHANLLSGLVDARLPVHPDYAVGYGLLVIVGAGLLLALALPALSPGRAVLLFAVVLAGIIGLNLWLAVMAGLAVPLAPALLSATASFALSMGYAHLAQRRARRELVQLFGAYVPPERVQEMLADPQGHGMQAASRELTVLFCDIRGFTALAETLEPAALQALLNRIFSRLTEVIRSHGGTIDKYIGDCVMAFWGAPVASPDHARRAVTAALALAQAVQSLNDEHRREGLPGIEVGIGLNTGPMCVGDMGSPQRRAYTVVGEAVNLAARLERLSARYGVTILVGEATRRQADDFIWQELDKVRVGGGARRLSLHTPWAAGVAPEPHAADALRAWAALLKAYRSQDVASCERLLTSLAQECPLIRPPLLALYAQRVDAMRGRVFDPDWDGAAPLQAS